MAELRIDMSADDYNRLLKENERLNKRIAELEAENESLQTGAHSCHDKCPRIACVQGRRIRALEQSIKDAECVQCCNNFIDPDICEHPDCWKRDALLSGA